MPSFTRGTLPTLFCLVNTRQLNESHCEAVLSQLRVQIVLQIGGYSQLERFGSGDQVVVAIQSRATESVLASANTIGRSLVDRDEIVSTALFARATVQQITLVHTRFGHAEIKAVYVVWLPFDSTEVLIGGIGGKIS